MDAAKIMILDDYMASSRLNSKRVSCTIPANDENIIHRPTTRRTELTIELSVALGEAHNVINLF